MTTIVPLPDDLLEKIDSKVAPGHLDARHASENNTHTISNHHEDLDASRIPTCKTLHIDGKSAGAV